jgi:hypothetical protein
MAPRRTVPARVATSAATKRSPGVSAASSSQSHVWTFA